MLPDYPQLILFLTAAILLNLTPGNDVLYIASQSLSSHRRGIIAALGISVGGGIYVLATAFGLSEIFRRFPLLFDLIKTAGAIYLLFLAWKAFFNKSPITMTNEVVKKTATKSFYMGVCTTLLNPKVGIFFITFLPQFTNSTHGKIGLQLLSLGACFIASGTLINLLYAVLIGHCRERLLTKSKLQLWLNKISALIFCALAIKVLTTKST